MNITQINNEQLSLIQSLSSVDIEQGYSIKEFYPKIIERFKDNAWIACQDYPLYRLTVNTFENAVIKGQSCEQFFDILSTDIYPIEDEQSEKIIKYTNTESSVELYKDIRYYFNKRIEDYLCDIIKQRTNDNSLELLTKGKQFLLSNYLSNISILYGLRGISQNVFIFYYQTYYSRFLDLLSYLRESCIKYLNKESDIIFSFRFIDERYKEEIQTTLLFDQLTSYKNYFYQVKLSNVLNITHNEEIYKNDFIIDNEADILIGA